MNEQPPQIYLPEKTAREQRILDLKTRANEVYLKIKGNQEEFKSLSKEYVEILKGIEIEIIKPNL